MPDLVIKKVKLYTKSTALLGIFDFANRNGILFEWNEVVDKFPEGIVEVEDVVLYPSLAGEHPRVVLGQDQPLPLIKEELVPQGRAKDAAACNANLQPFNVAGVVESLCVHANADKLGNYKSVNNDGIIIVVDIPQQPPHAPLVVNNTDNDNIAGSDDNDEDDAESNDKGGSNENDDAESNGNEQADLAAATDLDGNGPDNYQGVQ